MKKSTTLSIVKLGYTFLCALMTLMSVSELRATGNNQVCPEYIVLTSQAAVDAWDPTCNSVSNSLVIKGGDINDLSPLSAVTSIGRYLVVEETSNLQTLDGIESINNVGVIWIKNNSAISDISAIQSVGRVGVLWVENNPNLNSCSIDGICNITAANTRFSNNGSNCSSLLQVRASCDDDNDGIPNSEDNCEQPNPCQRDEDGDGIGYPCDPDETPPFCGCDPQFSQPTDQVLTISDLSKSALALYQEAGGTIPSGCDVQIFRQFQPVDFHKCQSMGTVKYTVINRGTGTQTVPDARVEFVQKVTLPDCGQPSFDPLATLPESLSCSEANSFSPPDIPAFFPAACFDGNFVTGGSTGNPVLSVDVKGEIITPSPACGGDMVVRYVLRTPASCAEFIRNVDISIPVEAPVATFDISYQHPTSFACQEAQDFSFENPIEGVNIGTLNLDCNGQGTVKIDKDFNGESCLSDKMTITYTTLNSCGDITDTDMITVDVDPAEPYNVFLPDNIGQITCDQAAFSYTPPLAYYDNVGSTSYAEAKANAERVDIPDNCEIWGAVPGIITQESGTCGGSMIVEYTFPSFCGQPERKELLLLFVEPSRDVVPHLSPDIPTSMTCSEAAIFSPPAAYYSNVASDYEQAAALWIESDIPFPCDYLTQIDGEITTMPGPCGGEMIITYAFPEVCDQTELNAIVSIMVDPAPEAFVLLPTVSSISCADAATFTPPNAHYSNDPNDIIISSIGGAEFVTAADPLAEACILKGELPGTIVTLNYDKCGGTIGVLYTGTDACGREVESPLIFFPVDAAADPVFVNVPANVELPCEDLPINGSGDRFWPTSVLDYTNGEGGLCEIAGQVTSQIFGTIDCNNGSVLTEEWLVELCPSTDGGRAVEYASASRTITILPDRTPPRLQGVPPTTEVDCAEELPAWPDVIATDNLDPDVQIIREEVPGYAGCGGGFFERIFTAIDDAGNRSTRKYTIRFTDEIAPTLTIPADTTLICGEMIPEPSYKAEDNCSSTQLDYTEDRTDHNPCEYTLVRTWKVRDGCGNSVTKSQTINVIDVEGPVITPVNEMLLSVPNGGSVAMYSCGTPEALMSDVLVSDNCCNLSDGQAALSLVVEDRKLAANVCDVFGYYSSWRCTYTATDAAGNISVYQFDVHQYDTVAPILERVPANLAVDSLEAVPDFDMSVTAIDECSGEVPVMVASGLIMNPDNLDQQLITRSWSATDQCGNRASADQQISVNGFDPMLITSAIVGDVYLDTNSNDKFDKEESSVSDISIKLYRHDQVTGQMTLYESVYGSPFEFSQLFPGKYQIEVSALNDTVSNSDSVGRTQEISFDHTKLPHRTSVIQLDTQEIIDSLYIGLQEPYDPTLEHWQTPKVSNSLTVFPNPFGETFQISYESSDEPEELLLFDKLGRLIQTLTSKDLTSSTTISLEGFPAGHYALQLRFRNSIETKKLIKSSK